MRIPTTSIDRLRPGLPIMVFALGILTLAGARAQAANLEEVTVTVPTVQTIGRDAAGIPIQQVTAMARIEYNPIMLTTNSGRALLQDKVADVARRLCRAGDMVTVTNDDDGTCVQRAVEGAKKQLDAAAAQQNAH